MSFTEKQRHRLKRVWVLGCIGLCILLLWPIEYRSTRAAFILLLFFTWMGALILWWRKKVLRTSLIVVAALPVSALCLPGRAPAPDVLATDYTRALRSFRGVRYVWGGENHLGIDCSGLVRKALVWGLASNGIRTLNGKPLRDAFDLWWHDASALALRDTYRGWTAGLFRHEDINTANLAQLKAGDLAVTSDGVHVLVYLGKNRWIEADPDENRVIEVSVPSSNPWFQTPVVFVRWKWLNREK
jgi:hypothetical protein